MTNPFSVVIPLYNKEKHIQRAINSVLAQTCQDFELIIVDDGSTDGSFEAASAITDARIRILRQENKGVSAARNRGVTEAKFDWVAFLDADDEWLPEFLEKITTLLRKRPDCGLYATSYSIINSMGVEEFPVPYPCNSDTLIKDIFVDFRLYVPFDASSVVANKEKLDEIGGFPINVVLAEDVITWMKLWFTSPIAFLNEPLSIYHHDVENSACGKYRNWLEVYAPVEFLLPLLANGKIPNEFTRSVIEYIAKHQLMAAKRNIRAGKPLQAFPFLWSCRKTLEQKKLWITIFLKASASLVLPGFSKRI